jgi:hypothetical protein
MSDDQVGLAEPRQTNGFAVAALITGALPTVVLGLIFGWLGIRRAQKVGRGMTMSIVGAALAILWIIPIAVVTPGLIKSQDPGCREAQAIEAKYPTAKLAADYNDPAKFTTDYGALVQGLTEAAAKAKDPLVRKYSLAEASDQRAMAQVVNLQQVPGADVMEQSTTDDAKLHAACGS